MVGIVWGTDLDLLDVSDGQINGECGLRAAADLVVHMVEFLKCVAAKLVPVDLLQRIALLHLRDCGIGTISHVDREIRLAWEQLMEALVDASHVRGVRYHVDAGIVATSAIESIAAVVVTTPVQQSIVRAVLDRVHDGLAHGLIVSLANTDLGRMSVRSPKGMTVLTRTSNTVAKSELLQRSFTSRGLIWPVVWVASDATVATTIRIVVRTAFSCIMLYRWSALVNACTVG